MTAVYAGSFDPVTNGHLDIIRRAALFCDRLIVGLLINPFKKSMFTAEERVGHLKMATAGIPNVEVLFFSGFLSDFVRANSADIIIRGLRSSVVPEYELQMVLGRPDIETVFMFSRPEYMYLSSTLVKEVILGGGSIDAMVPECLIPVIRQIRRNADGIDHGLS